MNNGLFKDLSNDRHLYARILMNTEKQLQPNMIFLKRKKNTNNDHLTSEN